MEDCQKTLPAIMEEAKLAVTEETKASTEEANVDPWVLPEKDEEGKYVDQKEQSEIKNELLE